MKHLNLLLAAVALLGLSLTGRASDIVEVIPLTDRIIMVHFDDGYVRHHQKGEARNNEWVIQDPLNVALATQLGSYTISSAGDSNFGGGVQPSDIGRKSKGTDFTWLCQDYNDEVGCINSDADHAKEHWIYLYLDEPMQSGSTYTITTGDLAANGNSYELLYDPKLVSSRSEAVHVNMIGYAPAAPKKYGYVYHWTGEKGGLDLSSYAGATFWLVNTADNSVAYSGNIAFRKAANNVETGQPDDTPDDNFLGAEVYEADFSSFATPGEYRLAVEGIGSSFPFVIDDNAYFEPYYNIIRGLYHQRSGIALTQPYTQYVRPAPHNPNVTPGFEGKLQYTTSRFVDWEEQDHSDNDKPAIEAGIQGPLDTYGWYQDAADWDGYFSHLRIPSWLLFLYEFAPAKFPDSQLNIPESGNGVPDLVDEAAWLPRFFHRTRQELIAKGYGTGGVGSRVAGDWFGGDGEGVPSYEDVNRIYIVSGEDPFTTYKYAATAAHLAIALQKAGATDPEGVDWLQEATEAYTWAQANTRDGDEEPVFGLRLSDQRLY
ncbi:MAG: cellulase N-terminal Ig-like domain-containing protein, partial [Tunicatimonas sp.]